MENKATSEDYIRDDEDCDFILDEDYKAYFSDEPLPDNIEELVRAAQFRAKLKSINFAKIPGGARDGK